MTTENEMLSNEKAAPQLFAVPDPAYPGVVCRSAIISDDGLYRYSLNRWWDNSRPTDMWIMCNPSTADANLDDATIRRCIGFSKRFGSGGFTVVNAYAYRATKPADLWAAKRSGVDIIGPECNAWITAHLRTNCDNRVIVAWGAHPDHDRVHEVRELIEAQGREALCLGTTKHGEPRHPLMLSNATEIQPYLWSAA